MESIVGHIGLAALAFGLTNIDDLLILSFYFADSTVDKRAIVIGQYAGILILVAVSLTGFVVGQFIDYSWLRFLGLVPVFLGVKQLVSLFRKQKEDDQEIKSGNGFWSIALITIANGGDNIGVYTPLFAKLPFHLLIIYVLVFIVMIAIWCFLSFYLGKHPLIKNSFTRYGHIVLPLFLIALGAWIVLDF